MAEQESLGPEQVNEFLFMQLVMMFQGAAYQQMGKVMNPATQKVERNLEQAKGSIDMIGMLEEKTTFAPTHGWPIVRTSAAG